MCYCPTIRRYFVSTDVTFFETTSFSLSFPVTIQAKDDDLLVYIIASLAPSAPTPIPVPVKPPITQVYSQQQNPSVSSPIMTASSSDLIQNDDLRVALPKGKRQCAHPISSFVSYNHLLSSSCSFIASLNSISLPNIVREALSHPGWGNAMVDEMQALDDNGTWDLVPLPIRKKAIGCRWVFAVKFNHDGYIARFKAGLAAKGYTQTYDIDYSKTFSPIAKLTYVRLFIFLVASYDWDLY